MKAYPENKNPGIELYTISETASVIEAMQKIDNNSKGIAFVCQNKVLKGCVTDGDIRRYILAGGDLSADVFEIANHQPVYLEEHQRHLAEDVMEKNYLTAVPVLNDSHEIVDICFWREIREERGRNIPQLNIPLVIMAGGKGTRLKPYTDILPKPLIPVDDKTITEHIMDQFAAYGCSQVTMIVNYKKDFIKAYFHDSETERDIRFIEEQEYMGTGGGLKLLESVVDGTFFMSNCDILVDADYAQMLRCHQAAGNIITLICARKKFEVPYGTVQTDAEGRITGLQEKPEFEYNVNTGLYIIEPDFLKKIPENTFIHITDIIEKCVQEKERVGTFLIDGEHWMDMGEISELEKMKEYYLQGGRYGSK